MRRRRVTWATSSSPRPLNCRTPPPPPTTKSSADSRLATRCPVSGLTPNRRARTLVPHGPCVCSTTRARNSLRVSMSSTSSSELAAIATSVRDAVSSMLTMSSSWAESSSSAEVIIVVTLPVDYQPRSSRRHATSRAPIDCRSHLASIQQFLVNGVTLLLPASDAIADDVTACQCDCGAPADRAMSSRGRGLASACRPVQVVVSRGFGASTTRGAHQIPPEWTARGWRRGGIRHPRA